MVPLNLQVPLADQFVDAPRCYDRKRADRELAALAAVAAADASLQALALCMLRPQVVAVLEGVFGASPYLTRLIVRYPHYLQRCLTAPFSALTQNLADELRTSVQQEASRGAVARALRLYKTQVAMLVALADLGGVWPVMTVTRFLSDAADAAVEAAVAHLFQDALRRGDWLDSDPAPEQRSGYFVLAVGKHGAFELNYSSDIDLVIFYDASLSQLSPSRELQTFFVRLTRDLVKLLQEPTEDGYVFRTDLRLRPDPGSTAVALSTSAALNYYESVGQNWERAALIKARVIAGDRSAGGRFLADLAPFIWRQNLDFAAIADIAAMKRQIHAVRGFGTIAVAGHNIKVGRGGIREVEFFTQTQQLIAGGRQREHEAQPMDLRAPPQIDRIDRKHDHIGKNDKIAPVQIELPQRF